MSSSEAEYDLVLVHGTFAREAEWIKPDSPLAMHLRGALPIREVHSFQWSGGNSFRARREAATELGDWLRRRGQEEPRRRHVLIAHSHGGNVCLGALADETAAKVVTCLACLSTPFITARQRPFYEESGDDALERLGYFLLFILWGLLFGASFPILGALYPDSVVPPFWASVLSFIATIMVVGWVSAYVGPRAKQLIEQTVERITRAAHCVISCPTLVVVNPRDEAAGALIATRFASWLVASPARMWQAFQGRREWIAGILGIVFLVGGSYYLGVTFNRADSLGESMFMGFFMLAMALAAISSLSLLIHSLLYRTLGRDATIVAPLLDLNVEVIPNGVSQAYLTSDPGGLGLAHSSVYDNPETWKVLADWIPTTRRGI